MATKKRDVTCLTQCSDSHNHIGIDRHWRSLTLSLILYFIVCALAVMISRLLPGLTFVSQVDFFGLSYLVSMPLLGLLPALVLARPLFLIYDQHAELTCHHLRDVDGILSLNKREIHIPFEDLLRVSVEQSIIERILRVGTLAIGTGVRDQSVIRIHGVANPQNYVHILTDRIDQTRIKMQETQH